MLMGIVIDSDSIVGLGTQIFKGLIIAILLFAVIDALYISVMKFIQGNKDKGYQYLFIFFKLVGSYALLLCVVYFGFDINLLEFLYN